MNVLPPIEIPGVHAKIARAREHRDVLKSEADAWVKSNPYVVSYKVNRERTRWSAVLESKRPFDAVRWALILGDVIHNLRSALDHLFWAIAERYAAGRTVGAKEIRDRKFPFFPSTREFAVFRSKHPWGIPDRVWEIIEDQQPYKRRNRHAGALFAEINKLDIIDKHHMLHVMATTTHEVMWGDVDPAIPFAIKMHAKLSADIDRVDVGDELVVVSTESALATNANPNLGMAYSVHVDGFPSIQLSVMVDAMLMITERTVDDVAFFASPTYS